MAEEPRALKVDRGSPVEPAPAPALGPAPAPEPVSPRKLRRRARKLLREGRRVRRWYSRKMSPVLREDLARLLTALASARVARDLDAMSKRSAQLAALLDGPLAYTKKSALREYGEQALIAVAIALFLRLVF